MNCEAHRGRIRQRLVQADERPSARPFPAPHERGSKLPGIASA